MRRRIMYIVVELTSLVGRTSTCLDDGLLVGLLPMRLLVTKDVTTGKITMASPMEVMIKSLSRERYQPIHEVVTQYYNPTKEVAIEEAEIARLVLEDLESGSVLALATATTNK
jgi:hypothetical protein